MTAIGQDTLGTRATLAPHAAAFVRSGPLDVIVTWGEPIPFGPGGDRKRATASAEAAVRSAVLLSGGGPAAPAAILSARPSVYEAPRPESGQGTRAP